MKNIFGLLLLAMSVSAFASDVRIEIINKSKNLKFERVETTFQATNPSGLCLEGMGEDRLPKLLDMGFSPVASGELTRFLFADLMNDRCKSELISIALKPTHSSIKSKPVYFKFVKVPTGRAVQKLSFKKTAAGLESTSDLAIGTDNIANIEVVFE